MGDLVLLKVSYVFLFFPVIDVFFLKEFFVVFFLVVVLFCCFK